MALFSRLTKRLCCPLGSGGDAASLRRIEQRAGEVMPGWDNRGIPGTQQWPAEQPQRGFADGELRLIDPDWRPM